MPNAMTAHSKELRRAAAKERRKNLRDLSAVLLNQEENAKLECLRRWLGRGDPATLNDTVKQLINNAYRTLPASAKTADQVELPLNTTKGD